MSKVDRKMFFNAPAEIFARAKKLRENETTQEAKMWGYLGKSPLGIKFRRQHPIKLYIADFYCHALKLVIEIDGGIHNDRAVKQYDAERQKVLEEEGIVFMRFDNNDVDNNFENIKEKIENYLKDNESVMDRKRSRK